LGNTCFFNSTLQCLNATTDLVMNYILIKKEKFPFKQSSLNGTLRDFFFDVRKNQKSSFNPMPLFSSICKNISRFRGYQQQDAHDLLINLLDLLTSEHDNINKRSKEDKWRGFNKSFVEEVFGGQCLNTVLCLECMRVSRTRDPMIDMSVTISFKQNPGIQAYQIKKMVKAPISSLAVKQEQMRQNRKKKSKGFFKALCICRQKPQDSEEDEKPEIQEPDLEKQTELKNAEIKFESPNGSAPLNGELQSTDN